MEMLLFLVSALCFTFVGWRIGRSQSLTEHSKLVAETTMDILIENGYVKQVELADGSLDIVKIKDLV